MALRKIGRYYYCYFRDETGKIKTLATRETERSQAEMFDRAVRSSINARRTRKKLLEIMEPELREKILASDKAAAKKLPPSTRGTLKLVDMFEIACTRRSLGSSHRYAWNRFLKFTKYTYAKEITPQIALAYLNEYCSKGNGKNFNNIKSALNTIFRACLVEAEMPSSPFSVIMDKSVTEIDSHRNMKKDEFELLFQKANTHTQIMMMLSRWTSQRLETCARMTPKMFDFSKRVFIMQPGKTKRFNEWVCCPIFPELEDFIKPILQKCKNKEKPIVENFDYPGNKNFSSNFSNLLKRNNITDTEEGSICFHSIRGTAITWMKENGIPKEERQSITGQKSDEIEEIYARAIENISRVAFNFVKKR